MGCKDIRAVDDGWPAEGSAFHHRVGLGGPLTVADSTKVVALVTPTLLVLEVRAVEAVEVMAHLVRAAWPHGPVLAAYGSAARPRVPDAVARYIDQHHLYRGDPRS